MAAFYLLSILDMLVFLIYSTYQMSQLTYAHNDIELLDWKDLNILQRGARINYMFETIYC